MNRYTPPHSRPQFDRKTKSKTPCRYFQYGKCRFGNKCKFTHVVICPNINTDRGCLDGSSCKFTHSGIMYGYDKVTGKKDCSLFDCPNINTDSGCPHGTSCKYSHKNIRKGYDSNGKRLPTIHVNCPACKEPLAKRYGDSVIKICKSCYNEIDTTSVENVLHEAISDDRFDDYRFVIQYDEQCCRGTDYHSFCGGNSSHDRFEKKIVDIPVPRFILDINNIDTTTQMYKEFIERHTNYNMFDLSTKIMKNTEVDRLQRQCSYTNHDLIPKIDGLSGGVARVILHEILELEPDSDMADISNLVRGYMY